MSAHPWLDHIEVVPLYTPILTALTYNSMYKHSHTSYCSVIIAFIHSIRQHDDVLILYCTVYST